MRPKQGHTKTPLSEEDYIRYLLQAQRSIDIQHTRCTTRILGNKHRLRIQFENDIQQPARNIQIQETTIRFLSKPICVPTEDGHDHRELPRIPRLSSRHSFLGKTEEEHDSNLHHLMKCAHTGGLIFNKEKCKINHKYIHFLTHLQRRRSEARSRKNNIDSRHQTSNEQDIAAIIVGHSYS